MFHTISKRPFLRSEQKSSDPRETFFSSTDTRDFCYLTNDEKTSPTRYDMTIIILWKSHIRLCNTISKKQNKKPMKVIYQLDYLIKEHENIEIWLIYLCDDFIFWIMKIIITKILLIDNRKKRREKLNRCSLTIYRELVIYYW